MSIDFSPTVKVMLLRRQHSDLHVYEASDLYSHCGHCGKRRGHSDHLTREEDKQETMRWRDRAEAWRE